MIVRYLFSISNLKIMLTYVICFLASLLILPTRKGYNLEIMRSFAPPCTMSTGSPTSFSKF